MADEVIRVLLVEDNPGDVRLVREMLHGPGVAGFEMTAVATVREAIDRLAPDPSPVDAVLLDLSLPDESGLDTLRRVVTAAGRAVVVVMTGAGDEQLGLAAMQEGAQDYLVKGQVDGRMLRRALRFAIERQDIRLELETLTLKDDLTGLHNRRGFLALAEQQLKVARRNRSTCLLLFLDLDQLKQVNDTLGHAEGDRHITEAADVLRACFHQSDIVARIGGDEFAALAISRGPADDVALRERLDETLRLVNARPDRPYPLGFSSGILTCPPASTDSVEALLDQADALMYLEKRQKQRVEA